jgi:hypothetical protein
VISFKQFTGEFPRSATHLLPDDASQNAIDCDFTANILTGLHGYSPPVNAGMSAVKSAFFYSNSESGPLNTKMYVWQSDADIVRGPIANDAYDRMYWVSSPEYNLKVTRDSLVGGGFQPDPLKTYDLGVPAPTLAPTAETNAFTYNGARLTDLVAVCETPTGTLISSESIMSISSVSYDTAIGMVMKANYSPKCKLYSEVTSQLSGTLPSGFAPAGTDSLVSNATIGPTVATYSGYVLGGYWPSGSVVTYNVSGGSFGPIQKYTYNGDTYLHWPDWLYAPLGSTMYMVTTGSYVTDPGYASDLTGVVPASSSTLVTSATKVYHIGSGWYCTKSTATPPSGIANNGSTFAIRAYFGNDYVTLRETVDRSSIPIAGYVGSFTYSNGVIEAIMNVTASSAGTYIEERIYVYTYVNIFGEESAPSPPLEISVKEGYQTNVTMAGLMSTTYAPITKIRLYRSATGSNTTSMLFVSEVENASSAVFLDTKLASQLVEPISTIGYATPETGLRGLTLLPNGILMAFKNNEIHFSEPYLPYAWNPANILTTSDTVISVCAAEGGFYVTTLSNPYFVAGITPDSMGQQKITAIQAGVSKGSICNIGSAVIYASNDGLVTARGLEASLDFSAKFFTRNDWRKLYGSRLNRMRLNAHDGHILAWFDDGYPGFLIRYDETDLSMTKIRRGVYAAAVHPKDDELYVCLDGMNLHAFKSYLADRREFDWTSKDFIMPKPRSFGVCQVAGTGTVTVEIYADDTLLTSKTITALPDGSSTFRVPSGGRTYKKWKIRIFGTAEITEFNLAGSYLELASV